MSRKQLGSQTKTPIFDYLFKSIIVGDSGVGKTNIVLRFTQDAYKNCHTATIGVDFKIKTINVEDKKIRLQVWDTAGQCKFRNITKTYFKGATGAIFTYAINDRKSFENISQWVKQANQNSDIQQIRILLGNKSDIESQRKVTKEEGEQLAQRYGMTFIQVSAKKGTNIDESFEEMAKQMKKLAQKENIEHRSSPHLVQKPPQSQCCLK